MDVELDDNQKPKPIDQEVIQPDNNEALEDIMDNMMDLNNDDFEDDGFEEDWGEDLPMDDTKFDSQPTLIDSGVKSQENKH